MDPDRISSPTTGGMNSLRTGDETAVRRLWEQYFQKLSEIARHRLHPKLRRVCDGEDVALSALDSLCRALKKGRFPDLSDPEDLWGVLLTITTRKIVSRIRLGRRVKRGGRGISDLDGSQSCTAVSSDPNAILSREPTPALIAELNEEFERVFAQLTDESLRTVLLMKLENYTNDEIAERLGCSRRTVHRKVNRIRGLFL